MRAAESQSFTASSTSGLLQRLILMMQVGFLLLPLRLNAARKESPH